MTGIRTGTRLEQLEQLRARIDHEIRAERRRVALETPQRHPARLDSLGTEQLLEQLGVTALDVKRWAVTTGLIPAVVRGRVPRLLVDAYVKEHTP